MKCPAGHDSASEDYCDVCGMLIAGAPSPAATSAAPAPAGEDCPECGAPKSGQFCESCGYDFATGQSAAPPPPAPAPPVPALAPAAAWTVVVSADRDYHDRVREAGGPDAGDIAFPAYCPERCFQLTGTEVQIGRRSPSRGLNPGIDLTGPPLDPGVSRLHAVLIATPEGGWAVLDPGSANGTEVNGAEIPVGQQKPLSDGDRISLGAWTTITIRQA